MQNDERTTLVNQTNGFDFASVEIHAQFLSDNFPALLKPFDEYVAEHHRRNCGSDFHEDYTPQPEITYEDRLRRCECASYICVKRSQRLGCLKKFSKVQKELAKNFLLNELNVVGQWQPHNERRLSKTFLWNLRCFLLDESCGDEMWDYLLSKVDFPKKMLHNNTREGLVNDANFEYFLEFGVLRNQHAMEQPRLAD